MSYRGFDGRSHTGHLVVNASAAGPLGRVFRQLYRLRFPIRHLSIAGRLRDAPEGRRHQRQLRVPAGRAVAVRRWERHRELVRCTPTALAVDLNPVENPYVGCGQSRDPASRTYFNRSIHRRGMVTTAVIRAFRSIGWGWGGSWTGDTKDYMHFSSSGH